MSHHPLFLRFGNHLKYELSAFANCSFVTIPFRTGGRTSISIMNLFKIRRAQRSNTSQIKKIIFKVLKEYGLKSDEQGKDSDLNDIDKYYLNSGGFFGVVEARNKNIIGTFGLYRLSDQVYELRKMYLLKEARGMGCGKMILNFAVQMAKESNINLIQLETISNLKEAIGLYKKFGFKETKPEQINDRVNQAFELMVNQ